MEITALCLIVASLRVNPYRSQFFEYESVSLSCEESSNSVGWMFKRNLSAAGNTSDCSADCGRTDGSRCFISDVFHCDSGVYWCESGLGECSNAVNITVTVGGVILESPVLPVMEGDDVTLRCRTQTPSNLTADFYKDGSLIGTESTGEMIIHSVSRSDEGLYKCNRRDLGESPESWLAVRVAGNTEWFHFLCTHILLPVLGLGLIVVLLMLLVVGLWKRHKGSRQPDPDVVTYADIKITQEVQPRRDRAVSVQPQPVYSTARKGKNQKANLSSDDVFQKW
ncbi:low affinity immunoglobulin gamma Fc region receptor II-b-like [Polymixia lowei]